MNWKVCLHSLKRYCFRPWMIYPAIIIYTFAGAFAFYWIEEPYQAELDANLTDTLANTTDRFLQQVLYLIEQFSDDNITTITVNTTKFYNGLEEALCRYQEDQYTHITGRGGHKPFQCRNFLQNYQDYYGWRSFWHAIFFVYTVYTTIGYGNISPNTNQGRILTIPYALFGIPIMLYTLNITGNILYKWSNSFYQNMRNCLLTSFTKRKRRPLAHKTKINPLSKQEHIHSNSNNVSNNHKMTNKQKVAVSHNSNKAETMIMTKMNSTNEKENRQLELSIDHTDDDSDLEDALSILKHPVNEIQKNLPISFILFIMLLYICLFTYLFHNLVDDMEFIDAAYYVFATITTCGFGDVMPSEENMIISMGFSFIGIILLSMCTSALTTALEQKIAANMEPTIVMEAPPPVIKVATCEIGTQCPEFSLTPSLNLPNRVDDIDDYVGGPSVSVRHVAGGHNRARMGVLQFLSRQDEKTAKGSTQRHRRSREPSAANTGDERTSDNSRRKRRTETDLVSDRRRDQESRSRSRQAGDRDRGREPRPDTRQSRVSSDQCQPRSLLSQLSALTQPTAHRHHHRSNRSNRGIERERSEGRRSASRNSGAVATTSASKIPYDKRSIQSWDSKASQESNVSEVKQLAFDLAVIPETRSEILDMGEGAQFEKMTGIFSSRFQFENSVRELIACLSSRKPEKVNSRTGGDFFSYRQLITGKIAGAPPGSIRLVERRAMDD